MKAKKTILLAISMPGIGACKMQTQFKSSKIVKTLKQYLNSELDLKTWKSQFSSSKSWKIRETIVLAIIMPVIGACKMQTQFKSSKSVKTREKFF